MLLAGTHVSPEGTPGGQWYPGSDISKQQSEWVEERAPRSSLLAECSALPGVPVQGAEEHLLPGSVPARGRHQASANPGASSWLPRHEAAV